MEHLHPIASIHMASGAIIQMEIYPEVAPNTVNSFMSLVEKGAYTHRAIKRIVPDFVIQPTYTSFDKDPVCDFLIEGEFRENGFDNPLTLSKYAVAMGGDGVSLASGSCFFIVVGDCEARLDGKYPGFARVISGFEEIDRLLSLETVSVENDLGVIINEPKNPEIIEKIVVETFGMTFAEPIKSDGILAYEKK